MLMPWAVGVWLLISRPGLTQTITKITAMLLWFVMALGVSLTYSRGPVVGVLAGALVFLIDASVSHWARWKALLICIAGGICLMFGLLWLSPAGGRFAPGFIATDASVANRWELWKGASQMIFIRPLAGLGAGDGGYVFSQWYQPEHLDYVYTSLLNSWLEIGAESGIPALAVCIFLCLLALGLILFRRSERNDTAMKSAPLAQRWTFVSVPAAASLATLMVCGMTSSVHVYKGVPWMVAANLLALAACGAAWRRQMRWRCLLAGSMGMTCLALAGLWIFKTAVSNDYAAKVAITADGVVKLKKQHAQRGAGRPLAILCDREQMGRLHGKRLREMLATVEAYDVFVIPDPRRLLPDPNAWLPENCDVAAFGRSVALLHRVPMEKGRTCYLVHPKGAWLSHDAGVRGIVWLPHYDLETGRHEKQAQGEMLEYRISSSLGGACSRGVIQQAKGFFW